jgi:hypothetical protein
MHTAAPPMGPTAQGLDFMDPKPTPPCRLSLVFASEAPVAVVLRRGPTEWVELIRWDTSTDLFEHGQWLHGRIYAERCGLSPNGRLFVYFAAKWGRVRKDEGYKYTFTAVSKPPYFTALAMWPQGCTWGGGGRFIDDRTLRLAYGARGTRSPDGTTELYMAPLPPHHPNHPPGPLNIQTDLDHYSPDRDFRCEASGYPEADWTGKDHGGRRIFTRGGVLYALGLNDRERMLEDFNTDVPRRLVSPDWARVWTSARVKTTGTKAGRQVRSKTYR